MNQTFSEQFERDCDTALSWIARFRAEDASEQDHRAFALWLAADAGHRQAMDLMLELWDDLGSVRHLPFDEPQPAPVNRSRRRWLGAAIGLAASVMFAGFLLPFGTDAPSIEEYQTNLGERRTLTLDDQSRIILNTSTRIKVAYSGAARTITLLRGEAFFEVQPDPERPFRVHAGSAEVTAIGTAFNIYRNDDDTAITVTEGIVQVSEPGQTANRASQVAILRAEEQLRTSARGLGQSQRVDLAVPTAWQRGELVARQLPLTQLTRELARYHDTRILIGDRDTANLTVSGVFNLDHPDSVLQALERSLALKVVRLDERTVQLLKAPQ
ncbi:FecR family protein [Kineobactrum salinum]|uniref:FecR family protein n=1 Tax=Kineobactrum salinum TaxID=2708301 RepID=A0A6C0U074_9GAMM|nr:FecR family protein [Kineobactrum salinum]QIB65492.1 FecR family protein [Kineobactrum salinum]